jgi:uncharacterized membrane protein
MKEIHEAICFAAPEAAAIADALAGAEQMYLRKRTEIERAIEAAAALLSQGALRRTLSPILSA